MNTAQQTEIDLNKKPDFDSPLTTGFLKLMRPLDLKYTYNSEIKDSLIKDVFSCGFEMTDQMKDNLDTYIYIARGLLRKERQAAHKENIIRDGWLELNEAVVRQAFKDKKKLEVVATMTNDWLTHKISKVYKPYVNETQCFLMDLKARSRGYSIHRFENAFCKLV